MLLFGCKDAQQNSTNTVTDNKGPTSQPVSKEVQKYRAIENEATEKQRQAIIDKKASEKELISNKAKTEEDYKKLKVIYKNKEETLIMRENAIKNASNFIAYDATEIEYLMNIMIDKEESDAFKLSVINNLDLFNYYSIIFQKRKDYYLRLLRIALENTLDKDLYTKIIEKLSVSHDPFAQQELIRNLRSENYEVLSAVEMMNILKKNMRPEYYPPVHQLMLRTKNKDVKANAISMLSKYAPSRTYIVKFMSDKEEDLKVRLACLKHLAEEDKASFYMLTRSVVMDESENVKMREACLKYIGNFKNSEIVAFDKLREDMELLSLNEQHKTLAQLSKKILEKF